MRPFDGRLRSFLASVSWSSLPVNKHSRAVAIAMAFPLGASLGAPAWAQPAPTADSAGAESALGAITVTGGRPTSLPAQIPTTIEGTTHAQIVETVNATDSEDALKYLPSLVVRKRYIGDFNHAVLATRASGTGNSARSMIYADGIMLSNPLGLSLIHI